MSSCGDGWSSCFGPSRRPSLFWNLPPSSWQPRPINSHRGEGPGTVIGPYKLILQIGEVGMGVVFVAEQRDPIRRKVALKIIKPGTDTRQVIAPFEAERQALALMEHPNIARVLDAGTTGVRDEDGGMRDEQEVRSRSAASLIPHPSEAGPRS
jgi:serine/threonine protein kinase